MLVLKGIFCLARCFQKIALKQQSQKMLREMLCSIFVGKWLNQQKSMQNLCGDSCCPCMFFIFCPLNQKSREGGVREGGVAQICRKLRAKFAQNCWYFVSYVRGRVRKIVANLSRI